MNTRASEQWNIIRQHVDFTGKTVIDLGCGHCDILKIALQVGAQCCVGVDKVDKELSRIGKCIVFQANIEEWVKDRTIPYDISICFSTLPYLSNPSAVLFWMQRHTDIALVECQYSGDGPGFKWLRGDNDMRRWLNDVGWREIQPIGTTLVKGRDRERTIWMCT